MGARELLADLAAVGLRVTTDSDCLVIRPASKLTDDMRAALREAKSDLLALLSPCGPGTLDLAAVAWTDADIVRFQSRRARLVRWGWSEDEAEKLAERLVRRDREGDGRRLCVECVHLRAGRCRQAERAGIGGPEVGAMALVLQNCPAFGLNPASAPDQAGEKQT